MSFFRLSSMQEQKRTGTKEEPALFICIGRQVLHMSESYSIEGCPEASPFSFIYIKIRLFLAEAVSAAAEQKNQKQPAAISAARASTSIVVSAEDAVISATAA